MSPSEVKRTSTAVEYYAALAQAFSEAYAYLGLNTPYRHLAFDDEVLRRAGGPWIVPWVALVRQIEREWAAKGVPND